MADARSDELFPYGTVRISLSLPGLRPRYAELLLSTFELEMQSTAAKQEWLIRMGRRIAEFLRETLDAPRN